MRRLAVLLAVALAIGAGTARGDDSQLPAAGVVPLPSAGVPNIDGALILAPAWLEPPSQPAQLSSEELQGLWEAGGSAYGIPWQVLAAINKIESNFGRNMGPSSAGAIGWMQFMPSTWLRWGTDADGNGVADPWNPQDAIYSAARYLAAAGGAADLRRAIFAYNHADWYVNEVLDLARLYGYGEATAAVQPTLPAQPAAVAPAASSFSIQPATSAPAQPAEDTVVFTLDQLQVRLDAAQQAVAETSAAYEPAAERARLLEQQETDLLQRAAAAPLLSDQLELQKQAVQLSFDREQAQFEATRLRDALEQGQAELDALREKARAASFNHAAANVLAAPISAPGARSTWVFPVGGGPDSVSVAHTHHDYPAADIAAPQGAPVYSLGDATVLQSWSTSDPRCGIGLTLRTTDGQIWTYCHLSYLDPAAEAGAELQAGASVGLVGMTGDASGPHLHLQLQPATSYPQSEEWFQAFAGTAFRWQDTPAPEAANPVAPPTDVARTLVFRIVQSA